MRGKHVVLALALTALSVWPVSAAIKAMTLKELMQITHDTVQGTVVSSRSVSMDRPYAGAIHTELTIQGVSLRTGEPVEQTVLFFGSHTEGERGYMSEQPDLADVRVGRQSLFFIANELEPTAHQRVHNWAGVYRIEQGFGEAVVIGKGEGTAFDSNVKLSVARERVRDTYAELQAEAQAKTIPGLK